MGHANSYALEEEDKGYEGSTESDGENDGAHSRYSQVDTVVHEQAIVDT